MVWELTVKTTEWMLSWSEELLHFLKATAFKVYVLYVSEALVWPYSVDYYSASSGIRDSSVCANKNTPKNACCSKNNFSVVLFAGFYSTVGLWECDALPSFIMYILFSFVCTFNVQ
ncbi:hypothetical protein Ancab_026781 [Ancistrocladus abbreviatus]